MDKFVFGDAVKNDFGNGPAWTDVEKNDFGNGPVWVRQADFSKSDPVPDWPADDPVGAMSIEGIEYGKSTAMKPLRASNTVPTPEWKSTRRSDWARRPRLSMTVFSDQTRLRRWRQAVLPAS